MRNLEALYDEFKAIGALKYTPESYKKYLEHYGAEPQKAKLCEELRELEEAAHDDLCAKSPETRSHFIEELADVTIMVEQAKLALTPEEEKQFHETITFKVQRQLGRIERGE